MILHEALRKIKTDYLKDSKITNFELVHSYLLDLCSSTEDEKRSVRKFKLFMNDINVFSYLVNSDNADDAISKAVFAFENHGIDADNYKWVIAQCVYAFKVTVSLDLGKYKIPLRKSSTNGSTQPKTTNSVSSIGKTSTASKTSTSATPKTFTQPTVSKPSTSQQSAPLKPVVSKSVSQSSTTSTPASHTPVTNTPTTPTSSYSNSSYSSSSYSTRNYYSSSRLDLFFTRHWAISLLFWLVLLGISLYFFPGHSKLISILSLIVGIIGIVDMSFSLYKHIDDDDMFILVLILPLFIAVNAVVLFFLPHSYYYILGGLYILILLSGALLVLFYWMSDEFDSAYISTFLIIILIYMPLTYFIFNIWLEWHDLFGLSLVFGTLLLAINLYFLRKNYYSSKGFTDIIYTLTLPIISSLAFFYLIDNHINGLFGELIFLYILYFVVYSVFHTLISFFSKDGPVRQNILTISMIVFTSYAVGYLYLLEVFEPRHVAIVGLYGGLHFIFHAAIHNDEMNDGTATFHFLTSILLIVGSIVLFIFPNII
ncbi:hypothetical protein N7548_01520 [Acholeplasma manati]|uniref:Uncharacterized protein n=1 Tax=Paracholeplasma manati TaxID=591373 RepID=A0ABT2Y449_9MOLU|nr:hypothetical protein [Paracholeplasma manati]MCV2231507.1 hypothetical protein [Paracholeplasma manati]